jgi:mannose-1-phosphate guanylyltransferase/mannose-6-phosphate isomerase
MKITPIILSGGSGTRLWPLSRSLNPKQFLSFFGKNSLFQDTVLRILDDNIFYEPLIVCNNEHRFIAKNQLQNISATARSIILEPIGRNTAPAIAIAAFDVIKNNTTNDDLMLVMPSDHIIKDEKKFLEIIENSIDKADKNFVVFGIKPSRAETGYGYIKQSSDNLFVEKFIEKPDAKTAQNFTAQNCYFWNSGIFMFRASHYLRELKRLQNEIFISCEDAYLKAKNDFGFILLDEKEFAKSQNISIDYAIMEKLPETKSVVLSALDVGWDDVGNWDAIAQNSKIDENKNSFFGEVIALDTKNCYVNSSSGIVAALGVKDLIIINLKDVVLVANKNSAQDVKKIFEILQNKKRDECALHPKVLRPWGSFETIDFDNGFKVKKIIVNPKSSLSLQMHHHRSEHWVVVKGMADVVCDDKTFVLHEGESTYIPITKKHRLENKHNSNLEIIEIQTGKYLGEDDIIRFSDSYGRIV